MKDLRKFSDRYLEILTGELAGLNLTRILDPEEFYNKQILDSVLPLEHAPGFYSALLKSNLVVDVGFGGGFPILPLAYLNPEKKFIGIEARRKKAEAVNKIANWLGLHNVACHHARVETIEFDLPVLITFKAVGKMVDFLSKVNSSEGVQVFFYKGPEVKELEEIEKIKNWKLVSDEFYSVAGTDGRRILGYVPRRTSPLKNKNLVKVSSLLVP